MPVKKNGATLEQRTISMSLEIIERIEGYAERNGSDFSAAVRHYLYMGSVMIAEQESKILDLENKLKLSRKLDLTLARLEEGLPVPSED